MTLDRTKVSNAIVATVDLYASMLAEQQAIIVSQQEMIAQQREVIKTLGIQLQQQNKGASDGVDTSSS